jgi:hypothetical protein
MAIIESIRKLNNSQFGSFGEYIFEYLHSEHGIERKHSENTDFILNGRSIDVKSARFFTEIRTTPKKYNRGKIDSVDFAYIQFYANFVICSVQRQVLFQLEYSFIEKLFLEWQGKRKARVISSVPKISSKFKTNLTNIKECISKHFISLGLESRIIYRTNQYKFGKESPGNLLPNKIKSGSVTIFLNFKSHEISESNINEIIAFRDTNSYGFCKLKAPKLHIPKVDLNQLSTDYKFKTLNELFANFKVHDQLLHGTQTGSAIQRQSK